MGTHDSHLEIRSNQILWKKENFYGNVWNWRLDRIREIPGEDFQELSYYPGKNILQQ